MSRLVPTIHAHGEATRLDAVLDLVAFSARPRPLSVALDELPWRIAKVFPADICSLYLLEGDTLVMRGNVGFPANALGEVRLAVGQGVTGLAVEYMRPISLNAAPTHESYRHFPGLGEERFPIFLAVPIAGPSGPLGALVLQRRTPPAFSSADIELAGALTAPIAAVAERAKLVAALQGATGAPARGVRRITLSGRCAVPGRALGMVRVLPRPTAQGVASQGGSEAELGQQVEAAVARAHRALQEVEQGIGSTAKPQAGYLEAVHTILDDARLRERAVELAVRGKGPGSALLDVGAEAVRAADHSGSEFAVERAKLIAEVCEALSAFIDPNWKPDLPRGAVLVGNNFTAFDLLVSSRVRPNAVVLADQTGDSLSRQLLALLGVPAVIEVVSLFRWSHLGEVALVDGDHGFVRLNPSRSEIAAVRRENKHPEE